MLHGASPADGGCGPDCSTLAPDGSGGLSGDYTGGECGGHHAGWSCGVWYRNNRLIVARRVLHRLKVPRAISDNLGPVASREPTPLAVLLPDVLGRLARDGHGGAALGALWPRVQGTVIGARSRPVELVDGVLQVEVRGATWRATLQAQEAVLRERWNAAVTSAPVRRIEFRLAP